MAIDLVLNELSLRAPAADIFSARHAMSLLLRTISHAAKAGAARMLRVHRDLNGELLAPAYPVSRWRNDGDVDREERRLFLSLATKAPFLADLPDRATEAHGFDCFCEAEGAIGFGVAWLLDALPVSILLDQRWDLPSVTVTIAEMDEDGELVEESVTLPHAGRSEHVAIHRDWFNQQLAAARTRQIQAVESGDDLWRMRGQMFTRLRFCDEVERQLDEVSRGSEMLQPILKRLYELEGYCEKWASGAFDPDKLPSKVSVESSSTLEMYGSERTFTHAGKERIFSWHVRLTPGSWRLYFEPDVQERVFYIGYIGKHLPTVKYRT